MKLKVEYLPIEEIKPYENNAKIHTPEQIEQIKTSIQQFGMNDPIGIWSKDNIIVEGHGRLLACQELGYKEVPVIRLDELTDEQRRAYTLAHNQLTMNTGFDIDILNSELNKLDFDMSEFGFEEINQEDIELTEDEYDFEEQVKPEAKSKRGEIYRLGDHVLMCGDSTEEKDVLKLMDGHIADLLVTDPPYNVALGVGDTPEIAKIRKRRTDGLKIENDQMGNDEFYDFLYKAFTNAYNSLKKGGAYYCWHATTSQKTFQQALEDTGLIPHQVLIWNKNTLVMGRQDYQWKHEPCFYGWKEGEGHYFTYDRTQTTVIDDKNIDFDNLTKEEAIKMLKKIYSEEVPKSIINENKPSRNELHPTMKPINLIGRLINNSSEKNQIVLDLFGGSGTTLIACEQLGRKCFMMEYDPIYVDAIIDRYEQLTGKKAVLINE